VRVSHALPGARLQPRLRDVQRRQRLDETFQKKYTVKILFHDYGFRHFWSNRKPIATPAGLKGLKLRVQQGRVFADTVNGLGASAVPMAWGEVIPAAQKGVIDGADLRLDNINALKVYEVSKYVSMTFHNYGPTLLVVNLDIWKSLTPEQQTLFMDVGRRRRLLPQGRGGEDLARVPAAVRRVVGQGRRREVAARNEAAPPGPPGAAAESTSASPASQRGRTSR
jgi:Bacterial extracellular solute-binding protein, family 7